MRLSETLTASPPKQIFFLQERKREGIQDQLFLNPFEFGESRQIGFEACVNKRRAAWFNQVIADGWMDMFKSNLVAESRIGPVVSFAIIYR